MKIKTSKVQVNNGDLSIDAYLAIPQGEETFPGIVVIQEIFGVNAHIREVTERIAKEGYVAIAPAIYQRQAPGFETGYTAEDVEVGRVYKNQTKASELLGDIRATIAYLQNIPQCRLEGVGCIGFCFGGHVAYLAATLPEIKATASFYGAGITSWCPGESQPTLTRTPEIKGTVYGFFGMKDRSILAADVEQIETALKQAEIPHQIFRYEGAEHGFFCDRRGSYNPLAAQDAWDKVKQLFRSLC